jgi:hypothetical protein
LFFPEIREIGEIGFLKDLPDLIRQKLHGKTIPFLACYLLIRNVYPSLIFGCLLLFTGAAKFPHLYINLANKSGWILLLLALPFYWLWQYLFKKCAILVLGPQGLTRLNQFTSEKESLRTAEATFKVPTEHFVGNDKPNLPSLSPRRISAVKEILGKTIQRVVVRVREEDIPRCQLLFGFEDGKSFEFFSSDIITPIKGILSSLEPTNDGVDLVDWKVEKPRESNKEMNQRLPVLKLGSTTVSISHGRDLCINDRTTGGTAYIENVDIDEFVKYILDKFPN